MKIKKGQAKIRNKQKKETIDLDNEIIIGLNTETMPKINSKTKKKKTKRPKKKVAKAKNNKHAKIRKVFLILILIIIGLAFVLLSDLFNCKEINVLGNNRITAEEIIGLSGIKTEENIFRINVRKVKENIKTNAYINTVKLKRKLDGKIEIIIEERTPTYMLTGEAGCYYINNQGYILEISSEPLALPTIMGLKTELLTKNVGDRLEKDDLIMLEKVILITNIAETKGLKEIITYINISNQKDIQIYMDSEKKTIHFGDEQDASKKLERLKVIIEQEKNNEGEIFIQNIENIVFREKV